MGVHSVALSDEEEAILEGLVAAGQFSSIGEALREGGRRLGKEEAEADALLARIMVGYDQAERGEFVDGSTEEVFGRVMARAEARWADRQGEGS